MERVPCKLNNERNEKHQTMHENVQSKLAEAGLSQLPAEVRIKVYEAMENSSVNDLDGESRINTIYREFDPGSGRTLAACLTHASRTRI